MSQAEQQELDTLKQVITAAIADGIFDREERDRITALMRRDHKIVPHELALIRTLISDKVESGELTLNYA